MADVQVVKGYRDPAHKLPAHRREHYGDSLWLYAQHLSSLQESRHRHQSKSLERVNESPQYRDDILRTHNSRSEKPARQKAQTSEIITRT